MYFKIDL